MAVLLPHATTVTVIAIGIDIGNVFLLQLLMLLLHSKLLLLVYMIIGFIAVVC